MIKIIILISKAVTLARKNLLVAYFALNRVALFAKMAITWPQVLASLVMTNLPTAFSAVPLAASNVPLTTIFNKTQHVQAAAVIPNSANYALKIFVLNVRTSFTSKKVAARNVQPLFQTAYPAMALSAQNALLISTISKKIHA